MAAPYVAGAAALIKARFPNLTAREIKARLLGGAVPTRALEGKVASGLMNIYNSLDDDQTAPSTVRQFSIVSSNAASFRFTMGRFRRQRP